MGNVFMLFNDLGNWLCVCFVGFVVWSKFAISLAIDIQLIIVWNNDVC